MCGVQAADVCFGRDGGRAVGGVSTRTNNVEGAIAVSLASDDLLQDGSNADAVGPFLVVLGSCPEPLI
jgi:hypothetical protein